MNPPSIQRRLLTWVLTLVSLAWLAALVATWLDVSHELDELLDSHLSQAAAVLVTQQVTEHDDDHRFDLPALHRYSPRVALQVFHEGRLVLRSKEAPETPMIQTTGERSEGFSTVTLEGVRWRVFATHGRENDVDVFVGEREDSRTDILWAVLRSSLWPLLAALPLLAGLIWWSVRRGLQPLNALGAQLGRRRPDEMSALDVAAVPEEMRPMVASLNQLFVRIESLIENERRFTADAAHELRTPIAAIRAHAQVALGAADEAERKAAIDATLQGCDRAGRLVDQMLTLARLETLESVARKSVDMAAVARDVLAVCAPIALRRGQQVALDAQEATLLQGDAELLAILLRNLVDNAIRYCPAGCRIHVVIRQDVKGPELRVEDEGPGMSDGDIAALGQRFNRAAGQQESGSGLGWSIVQRIARLHGLTIQVGRVSDAGRSGTRIRILQPA